MSLTIYLIRHGESEANERDVFLGHYNMNLTKRGKEQAAITADYLINQVKQLNAIYSSDLDRAYQTAKCTSERFNVPIIKNEKLREIDAGLWDNLSFTELADRFTESYRTWNENLGIARCDGGESVAELQQRIVSEVEQIAKKHKNGTIFIFTHATPIRTFGAYCLKKSLEEIKTLPWASNASVTKVIYDKGRFELVEYSYDSFMGKLSTKLPDCI